MLIRKSARTYSPISRTTYNSTSNLVYLTHLPVILLPMTYVSSRSFCQCAELDRYNARGATSFESVRLGLRIRPTFRVRVKQWHEMEVGDSMISQVVASCINACQHVRVLKKVESSLIFVPQGEKHCFHIAHPKESTFARFSRQTTRVFHCHVYINYIYYINSLNCFSLNSECSPSMTMADLCALSVHVFRSFHEMLESCIEV